MAQKIFGITIGKDDGTPKKGKTGETVETLNVPTVSWKKTLPEVNAIPQEILEKYENNALIKTFGKIAVGIIMVGVLMFGYNFVSGINHDNKVLALENESARIMTEINALTPYQSFKNDVDAKTKTLSSFLSTDVDVAKIFATLNDAATANSVELGGVTISIADSAPAADGSSANTGACPSTDPFSATPSIGCISFDGVQKDDASLKVFFDTLTGTTGITNVFVANVTYSETDEGDSNNTFKGSASFTDAFYSLKYGHLATSIDAIISAGGLTQAEVDFMETLQAERDAAANGVAPVEEAPVAEDETIIPEEDESNTDTTENSDDVVDDNSDNTTQGQG